jgi:hypothetical protein
MQKAKLNNYLLKLSRPLGVVSANPNLDRWPGGDNWDSAASQLITALQSSNVTVEYYKQNGRPIMDVFGKDSDWTKVPE